MATAKQPDPPEKKRPDLNALERAGKVAKALDRRQSRYRVAAGKLSEQCANDRVALLVDAGRATCALLVNAETITSAEWEMAESQGRAMKRANWMGDALEKAGHAEAKGGE